MSHTGNTRLALALAVACCAIAALASSGAEQASGSTGCNGNGGFNFELGIANACDLQTALAGNSGDELTVTTSSADGIAIEGNGSSATGAGWGVYGRTEGGSFNAYG